jgi:glycosyltransferase involved in cell wall biosynthesis
LNRKKKNILLLHSSSDLYGASKIFLDVINILIENNYNIIVCLSENGPLVDKLKSLSVRVEIFELGILRRKYNNIRGIFNRVYYFLMAVLRLIVLCVKYEIDIIYSNTLGVICGLFAAKLTLKKHIWHIHEIINKPRLLNKSLKCLLKYSTINIVVSNEVKKCWAENKYSDKYVLLYNGIVTEKFDRAIGLSRTSLNIPDDSVVIGMIARVHYWKGQDYFLNIANILNKQFHNLFFVLVGDAYPGYEYLYEKINGLIKEYNLGSSLINLGYREDIPEILKMLDIFILPSVLPDPLPTTVLEAMASSKPVIATGHGGALEMVVNGETGFHIPYNNPGKASNTMAELIKNKNLRVSMGIKGRKLIDENFSMLSFNSNLKNILDRI